MHTRKCAHANTHTQIHTRVRRLHTGTTWAANLNLAASCTVCRPVPPQKCTCPAKKKNDSCPATSTPKPETKHQFRSRCSSDVVAQYNRYYTMRCTQTYFEFTNFTNIVQLIQKRLLWENLEVSNSHINCTYHKIYIKLSTWLDTYYMLLVLEN